MIDTSLLRGLFSDVALRGRLQSEDFRNLLNSAAGANRIFNRVEFIDFARDYMGLDADAARTAFDALASGGRSVRVADIAAYIDSFDRNGDGVSFGEFRQAAAGLAAGRAPLAAPVFEFSPTGGATRMDYDAFARLMQRAGLTDAALLRAVFDDIAGPNGLLSRGEWADAFGRAPLGRDAFREAALSHAEDLGFVIFDRAAGGNGRLGFREFSDLALRVGYEDEGTLRAVFDLIAGDQGYVSGQAWNDLFGSPYLAGDMVLTLLEDLAEAETLIGFRAVAGNGRVGYGELVDAAARAGIADLGPLRSVFDGLRGSSPYLTEDLWRRGFGALTLTPTRFADAIRTYLDDETVDLGLAMSRRGLGIEGFRTVAEQAGLNEDYTTAELDRIFDGLAGADGIASRRELKTAFGSLTPSETELAESIGELFDRFRRH